MPFAELVLLPCGIGRVWFAASCNARQKGSGVRTKLCWLQSTADQQKEYSCCVAPAAESVDILDQQELKKT